MHLQISIEQNGRSVLVGHITGSSTNTACFSYASEYLNAKDSQAISISLPLQAEPFSAIQTRNFFDGLLPEGFTRRTIAQHLRASEDDYLSVLSDLGKECLGAIRVTDDSLQADTNFGYEPLSLEQVRALAREGATKSAELVTKAHLSLTGASGKVGLYYDAAQQEWYLPLGSAPSTHIVKQSHVRLADIVTNEQLSLRTAQKLGLDVADSFIINTGNHQDSDVLFASQRYDRSLASDNTTHNGLPIPLRLHQEDFAQAMGIASIDKYEKPDQNYMIKMFDLLRSYSQNPLMDRLKLWDMIIFNFLLGNNDAHIKNFSLLYNRDISAVRLAPAYDIISTTIYPSGSRNMAFSIGGEYSIDLIDANAFRRAAKEIGISEKMAMSHFASLVSRFESALSDSAGELLMQGFDRADQLKEMILCTGGISHV